MKTIFSLPKDEGFFQSYAHLGPTLRRLGYIAQVISAATEIGVIFALAYATLKDFIPEYAAAAAWAVAILGTLFLEVGLRQFLPYSARAILYRRFAGLHLPMTIFIFAVALGLIGASGFLSFKGSRELVATVAPPPALGDPAQADSLYLSEAGSIQSRYAAQVEAINTQAAAAVKVEALKLEKYTGREQRTGRSYATTKERIRAKMAAIEADAAGQVAALQAAQGEELAAAHQRRTQGREEVETANNEAKAQAAAKVAAWGLGAGWFTLFALAVLIVVIALDEIYRKGAGVETQALPTQYDFSQSIAGEFMAMASEKWNYYARAFIRRLADGTPEPPEPGEPPTLYDYSPQMKRRQIGFQKPDDNNSSHSVSNASGGSHSVSNGSVSNASGSHSKNCLHCGQAYQPRVSWQKYCSTQCKDAYHAAQHGGQSFDPKAYHKGKK